MIVWCTSLYVCMERNCTWRVGVSTVQNIVETLFRKTLEDSCYMSLNVGNVRKICELSKLSVCGITKSLANMVDGPVVDFLLPRAPGWQVSKSCHDARSKLDNSQSYA